MDLGEPQKIIRIEISCSPDLITILQQRYIEAILKRKDMERSNPVAIPLDPNVPIEANTEDSDNNRSNPFARLLGELQYLANAT